MLVPCLFGDSMREKGHIELALHAKVTPCCMFRMPFAREGEEDAMMNAGLVPQGGDLCTERDHINNHISHSCLGAQLTHACRTDGALHTQAVVMTTYHSNRHASPGAHVRHHSAL